LHDQTKIIELDALEEKVCSLRERFGNNAILRASLMGNTKSKQQKFDETSLPGNFLK